MPSVLFLNRVYPPVPGATGDLLAELAPELARRGWTVTVLTTGTAAGVAPDPDRGRLATGPRASSPAADPPLSPLPSPLSELPASAATLAHPIGEGLGVRASGEASISAPRSPLVSRVRGLPFTRASVWRRALSYLSLYPALLWRAWRLPRADVTVLLTDPPLQLVLGPFIRLFKRTRLVHWAQDLYPEVAEQLDVIRERGLPARLLRGLSTLLLRRCARVVAVGHCMKTRLIARGVVAEKVVVIPNWANTGEIQPVLPEANAFRREHGLAGHFVVMYSGNFGLAHTFDAILDAAGVLQAQLPAVLFLLCGDGPRLAEVQEQVAARALRNVRFLPFQPREQLAQSLSAADVHLVSMRDDLLGLVVPSKVYGVLAAGRPCVFLGPRDCEVAELIAKHRCGSVLPQATGAALADCLGKWASSAEELAAAGVRALASAKTTGLPAAVAEWDRVLASVASVR
jgi:glycosyltransferase involved in cell wall biosynthesis